MRKMKNNKYRIKIIVIMPKTYFTRAPNYNISKNACILKSPDKTCPANEVLVSCSQIDFHSYLFIRGDFNIIR